jgi:hypothetical protein
VSGVVDPEHGPDARLLPCAAVTVGRLRADSDEIRRRLTSRSGGPGPGTVDDTLREAAILEASDFADFRVDTTGLAIDAVVRQVRERSAGWRAPAHASGPDSRPPVRVRVGPGQAGPAAPADGQVLLICGATGAGKSSAGFQAFLRLRRAGIAAAYLDLDQIGFCPAGPGDPAGHAIRAGNLAAIWQAYRAAGAQRLVAVGRVGDARAAAIYAAALPAASLTLARLHASPAELTRRVMLRGRGGGSWPQPGDPLLGQPEPVLRRVAAEAAAQAGQLERAGLGAVRVDTDGRPVPEVARLLLAQSGWPGVGS